MSQTRDRVIVAAVLCMLATAVAEAGEAEDPEWQSRYLGETSVVTAFGIAATSQKAGCPTWVNAIDTGFHAGQLIDGMTVVQCVMPSAAQSFRGTPVAGSVKPMVAGFFSTWCNTEEVLVGVYGRAAVYLDRIGGYCVRVAANGDWDGEVRIIDGFGGSGGAAFDRKCARNHAITGFRGRHGASVDRIEIRCSRLSSPTSVTGGGSYVPPAVGGSGGNAFGPYSCPAGKPAAGFNGQEFFTIHMLQFLCRP